MTYGLTLRRRGSELIRRLRDEAGYSLIEVMASIVILTLAILPMTVMFDMGLKSATKGGSYDRARALANTKLEEIKSLDYSKPETVDPDSAVEQYPPCGTVSTPTSTDPTFSFEVRTTYVGGDSTATNATMTNACPGPTGQMSVEVKVVWDRGEYKTTGMASSQ